MFGSQLDFQEHVLATWQVVLQVITTKYFNQRPVTVFQFAYLANVKLSGLRMRLLGWK